MSELLKDRQTWFEQELAKKDAQIEQVKKWLDEKTKEFSLLSRQKDQIQKYYDMLKSSLSIEQQKNAQNDKKLKEMSQKIKKLEQKCEILKTQTSETESAKRNFELEFVLSKVSKILNKIHEYRFKTADLDTYREMVQLAYDGLNLIKQTNNNCHSARSRHSGVGVSESKCNKNKILN